MSFIEAVKSFYRNYFNFKTRASRSELWWFVLFNLGVALLLTTIDLSFGTYSTEFNMGLFVAILNLINFIPFIALYSRRLHDIGRSGWWQLLCFTGIGAFVVLYWFIKKGEEGSNRFGNNPLGPIAQSYHSGAPMRNLQTSEYDADITVQRLNEDQLYEQVAAEMDNEDIKPGLWAKATAHAEGNESKTKALYITYRVQALQIEVEEKEIIQKEKQEQDRLDNLKKIKEEKEAKETENNIRKAEEHFNEAVVKKNKSVLNNAAREFKKAAQLGHSVAQCELGILFLSTGYGVSRSYKDAHKWFSLSAEQGNSIAQYNLGLLYKNGLGVNVDLVQAFIWFKEAATLDHQLAMEEISKLVAEDKNNYLTKELIEQLVDNEVRFDGVKFHYTGYAYDNLETALAYAKSCNS